MLSVELLFTVRLNIARYGQYFVCAVSNEHKGFVGVMTQGGQ